MFKVSSLLKAVNIFALLKSLFKDGLPLRAKIIIAVLVLVIFAGGGIVSFKFYDFTQNNPKFCVSCHLMKPAFEAWAASGHKIINCHDCHHLSVSEQNKLLVTFVMKRPQKVPERHGKIIVPWKYCIKCHWEKDEKYPDAFKINRSPMHTKHYFTEQIECSKCHGYITGEEKTQVHKFVPGERFCMRCHQGKEVHGTGMEDLACLNCHTDRTRDLRPGRKKCLFCHGGEDIRRELITDGTIDVIRYQPEPGTIRRAIKINVPADAPMQFYCYECHKPHKKIRPDWGDCVGCHENIPNIGKHGLHLSMVGMKCKECHKPHLWKVTPEGAKTDCTKCHEYKDPKSFLS